MKYVITAENKATKERLPITGVMPNNVANEWRPTPILESKFHTFKVVEFKSNFKHGTN